MYLHSDRTKFPEVREEIEQALRLVPLFSEEADRTMFISFRTSDNGKKVVSRSMTAPPITVVPKATVQPSWPRPRPGRVL